MKQIQFQTLDEVFDCYGRGNLVAIDNIHQIIDYTRHGCQPKFIYENEMKPGRLTCWYLKSETSYVHKKWLEKQSHRD